jgi:hypothetical protein
MVRCNIVVITIRRARRAPRADRDTDAAVGDVQRQGGDSEPTALCPGALATANHMQSG